MYFTGKLESIRFTFGGRGNQSLVIDGKRYVSWFDVLKPELAGIQEGSTVLFTIDGIQEGFTVPTVTLISVTGSEVIGRINDIIEDWTANGSQPILDNDEASRLAGTICNSLLFEGIQPDYLAILQDVLNVIYICPICGEFYGSEDDRDSCKSSHRDIWRDAEYS